MTVAASPAPHRARAFAAGAALFALLALLAAPPGARADDPAPSPGVPPAWVTIATVEHTRGNPAALEPFLTPETDAATRRRAIVALGRIGNRKGVADLLRVALSRGGDDIPLALDAVALTRDAAMLHDVLPLLDRPAVRESPPALRAAVDCVGFLGDARADGFLLPLLAHADGTVRGATATALGRMRAERDLEALRPLLVETDDSVRSTAAAAAWRLGAARRAAATKKNPKWDGDPSGLEIVSPLLRDGDPDTRMYAVRAVGSLLEPDFLPIIVIGPSDRDALARQRTDLVIPPVSDPDPRVSADAVSRIVRGRTGEAMRLALSAASVRSEPLVRETVADVCGEAGAEEPKSLARTEHARAVADILRTMLTRETDVRVREAIAVGLAKCGDRKSADSVLARTDRPQDPVARGLTETRVLLAGQDADSHAKAAALARDSATPDRVRWEILDLFKEKDGPLGAALAREFLFAKDPVVRESAVALLGEKGGDAAVADLVAALRSSADRTYQDSRIAAVKALSKIVTAKDAPPAAVAQASEAVRAARSDPSPFVRLAAREAVASWPAEKNAPTPTPEDPRPNDWRGLPRPKAPVLGLDLTKGDPWLSEEEILRLAAEIVRQRPRFVVENDVGEFTLEVDAEKAPVHAVNLLLCAAAHVYDGTPWHRVVPAFVIQGGDPRGDGSGDAGYSVPDEITDLPYVRGALGMPKNTKDTGGCQLFVMHCAYPPLDRNYTCYGRVVSGMDVVDKIRVGDRIRTVRIETK